MNLKLSVQQELNLKFTCFVDTFVGICVHNLHLLYK